jgi:ketosteroid isomerase-like protein
MPQDQPVIIGKEAIRSIYQSVLKEYDFQSESTIMEIEASGDWGFIWSTYKLIATPKGGGEPVKSSGKSVFIVKRDVRGVWKIARLIDNCDGTPIDQDKRSEPFAA